MQLFGINCIMWKFNHESLLVSPPQWLVMCTMMYKAVTLVNFNTSLSFSWPSFFPLFSFTIMLSCVLFPLPFLSPCRFLLSLFIPTSLCICFSSLVFFVGESSSCQIKASPHALSSCVSMRWWALNNIHSQQTFKRARLASYMICWCAVLLLLGALVFWRRGRDSQSRERFGSFMGLNLPLCGEEGSLR